MFKRILIAVDGSVTSNRVVQEAIRMAKEQQASLRLVHVVDEASIFSGNAGWMSDAEIEDALVKPGQKIVEEAHEQAHRSGIETGTALLRSGDRRIAEVILEEARRWQADLIMIGTHGRHGVEHLLLGSVAEGVIRATPVPVLLVRGQ